MVAAVLLLVGLLGTVKLIDVASSSQGDSKAREGATNLARELLEDAHNTSFRQVGATAWITPSLAGLSNDTNSTNTVTTPTAASAQATLVRRKISYTANVSWCSVDDPKDGSGAHSASITWCSDSTTTGTGDSAPEDLKRVTATITYSINGNAKTLSETVTFSATGGMVAPSVQSLCASGVPIGAGTNCTGPWTITDSSATNQSFIGTAPGAADMKFAVNGAEVTSGVTNNNNGTWTFAWPIALANLADGNYAISATAVDALGNRSQPMSQQVKLARGSTVIVTNVQGGYNYVNPTGVGNGGTEVVELQWDASGAGSVTGYEVLRGATSVCGGQTSLANSCIDTSPPTTPGAVTTYTIKTWYQDASGNPQSASTTYNVTAPAPQTTYFMTNSQTNPTTKCDTGIGAWRDLLGNYPLSFSDSTSTASAFLTCTPAMPSGTSLSAGTVTADFWVTNGNNKSCTTVWWISHNATPSNAGTTIGSTVSYTAPSSSTTHISSNESVPATTLSAGDQINLFVNVRTASGNCSVMTLDYGGFFHPSSLSMPSLGTGGTVLAVPNSPTGLAVTANADGTRTLTWNAPTSSTSVPAPDFYRIYRDGTATSDRLDTADAVNTSVSTASSAGATTLAVAGTTGYSNGQTLLVDTGANQDSMTISSISGNTITFTAGMTHAHAVNVPVVLRAVSFTDTTASSSHTYRVTAVSPALGESTVDGPITG